MKKLIFRLAAVALVFVNLVLFLLIFPPSAIWFISTGKDLTKNIRPFKV